MHFRSTMAAAAAVALANFGWAHAACNLKTLDIPVKVQAFQPVVSAKINGQALRFLVDSGSFLNSLNSKVVKQQNLKSPTVPTLGTAFGRPAAATTSGFGGGERVVAIVTAPNFEFGGGAFRNVSFLSLDGFGDLDGIIGQNLLHQIDDEYDMGQGMMRLVQPQDCASVPLAYWAKGQTTYSVLPLITTNYPNYQTAGTVLINGVPMRGQFDTGSEATFITARAAARAGVKTTDPAAKAAGIVRGIDRVGVKTWIAPFASVKIGDEEIRNTPLRIGDTASDDFDVLIGMDFFLAHHVYVANSQGKLYFTYNGGSVFNVDIGNALEH